MNFETMMNSGFQSDHAITNHAAREADSGVQPASDRRVKCPVCRATQLKSQECRRCGADLELLVQFDDACETLRARALKALDEQEYRHAAGLVRRLYQFRPTTDALRLLAVCAAAGGDFRQAVNLAVRIADDSTSSANGHE